MEIDVVVLSLDRVESTLETLDNISSQKGVQPTIWLVDQGSKAETFSQLRLRAQKDGRIKLIELRKNIGVAAGRNVGMRAGGAEIIVALDNDAIFGSENTLAEIARFFEERPDLAVLSFRIENYFSGELDMTSWVFPKKLLNKSKEPFLATRFTGGGNAMRRSAYEETKGYDERLFFYWEELDLAYQMIQLGYRIGYEPAIVVRHKVALEGRTNWKGLRYYYLVRNALFLNWKYFGSVTKLSVLASGYLAKGLYNGVIGQALRGIGDALGMIRKLPSAERVRFNIQARAYIQENDVRHRGNIWQRVWREVLAPLPR